MPTIVRLSESLKICMYAGDHNPPHFHVIHSDGMAFLVSIETLQVIQGEARGRDFGAAISWAHGNHELLVSKWAELNERD